MKKLFFLLPIVLRAATLVEPVESIKYDIFAEMPTEEVVSFLWQMSPQDPEGKYTLKVKGLEKFLVAGEEKLTFSIEEGETQGEYVLFPSLFYAKQNGNLLRFSFALSFPAEQMCSKGVYSQEWQVELWREDELVAKKPYHLQGRVEESAQVCISEWGETNFFPTRYALIDFGLVTALVVKNVTISVRANYGYSLQMISQNQGKLQWQAPFDLQNPKQHFMDYRVNLDQKEVPLTAGGAYIRHLGKKAPLHGDHHLLQLTLLPDLKKNFSGKYKDQIFISVIADE